MYELISSHANKDLYDLIDEAPEINAHMTAVIIRNDTQKGMLSVWGRYEQQSLVGVVVVYNSGAIVYEREGQTTTDLIDFFQWNRVNSITGPGYLTERLKEKIAHKQYDFTHVARLDTLSLLDKMNDQFTSELANGSMYLEPYTLINLRDKIGLQNEVFKMNVDPLHAGVYQLLESQSLSGYIIRDQGQAVAVGEWLNIHPRFGLIVGIATHQDFRRRHYAQQISIALCKVIVKNGKIPLLRYSNPHAGELYRKMGFVKVGTFATLYL